MTGSDTDFLPAYDDEDARTYDRTRRERGTGGQLQRMSAFIDLDILNRMWGKQERAKTDDRPGVHLPPRRDCPTCGGAGWLKHDDPRGEYGVEPWRHSLVECPCRTAANAQRRQARLDRWSTLAEEWPGATFARTQAGTGQRAALLHARAFADDPEHFLVLLGLPGRGKSRIAAAIAWELHSAARGIVWVRVSELIDHIRDSFNPASGVATSDLLIAITEAPVLLLDDLGAENPTAFVRETVTKIIDRRYVRGLPMVVTTNVGLDRMPARDASRLADARNRLALVHGGDKRREQGEPETAVTAYHAFDGQRLLCAHCHADPCVCAELRGGVA